METIVLDPNEVSTGRTELNLSALNLIRADPGIDWGDGAIEAAMSQRERGEAPIDFRFPNRQITIPLVIKQAGSTSFHQARLLLQQKVARIQQEGGWLRRTTSANTTVFADIVNASLHLGGSWLQAQRNVDIDAELRLEAIPDWYGPEVVLADHVETTQGELVWTETAVAGDYPGRVRLVVDEDQGVSQQGLIWGVRSRHYSNSTTAQLKYEAETCTPMDLAVINGTYIRHFFVATSWTPIMSTDQTGGIALTHTGSYRVWARAYGESTAGFPTKPPSWLRLVWDVGDFSLPAENDPVQIPGVDQWYAVDLGEVRLDRVPAGSHRWRGVIQGYDSVGVGAVRIDKIWLVPVDEGYGVLRAPVSANPGLASYLARDEFLQSGVLTGKSAAVGGTWQGTGDTDDFVYNPLNLTLQRTSMSDTGSAPGGPGRFATLSVGAGAVVVHVDSSVNVLSAGVIPGVLARFQNTSNYLMATARLGQIGVGMVIGGVSTSLGQVTVSRAVNIAYSLRLGADASGRWFVWWGLLGGKLDLVATGLRTELATGGSLASGGVGIYDQNSTATAAGRVYDNFAAWPFPQDAVLFAGQSAELRTEGMFREDTTGTAFGPVTWVSGDLPRIPPSGAEGRTVQFFVKASRGDLDRLPDPAQDDISARVSFRPSFLFVS